MTRSVKLKIAHQGPVVVNGGYVRIKDEHLAAIEIDMRSKYAVLSSYGESNGNPAVMLLADERTLHLDTTKPKEAFTDVEILGFKGWSVYMAECARYTLQVVLIKKDAPTS